MKQKKYILIIGAILIFFGAITSCGPSKAEREEAARQDSIRIADSIAKAEEEARLAAIEAARQDSLARIEKFKQSIPPFKDIYFKFSLFENEYDKRINLEKLGFSKKTKTQKVNFDGGWEVELSDTSYLLELDSDHYCLITDKDGYEAKFFTFKIVGFPELMEQYKAEAKALKSSPDFQKYGQNPLMEINKNEIKWEDGV